MKIFGCFLLIILSWSCGADVHIRTPISSYVSVGDNWLGYIEGQLSFSEKISSDYVKTGIGYKIDKFVIWNGYHIQNNFGTHTQEYRSWQGITWTDTLNKFKTEIRVKTEERVFPNSLTVLYRICNRIKEEYHIDRTWSLVAYDELYINLNSSKESNTDSGISENEIFAGIKYNMTHNTSLLVGYANQQNFDKQKINNIIETRVHMNF